MSVDVTRREALTHLGASTAEAVARVLEMFVPDGVERGDVSVVGDGQNPFINMPVGGIAASVRYIDGVTGANVFMMPAACARVLAHAMGVGAEEGPLTELEMSAIGEASNQMLASAAAAISVVIGQDIEISPPDVRILDAALDTSDVWGTAPYACSTSFMIAGEPCRLIQLVPSAFVVRMARAIDELTMEQSAADYSSQSGGGDPGLSVSVPITEKLEEINLRVWAELGRTKLPIGAALELPLGSVIDLDRTADAPVDLFINGLCFGHGHLLVTEDGEWAIEVTSLKKPSVRKPALVGGAGIVADTPKS
ncbi:MAG TPA: FliM/FliN family flagellar motor switch protein [Solirubrobacteraceae bacterium]|jgi:flagellar motor switch protein FliN/FliY|nr:FliM/FliN family flagellar motor switch protein [Solirubrobacteraceae bacterium]